MMSRTKFSLASLTLYQTRIIYSDVDMQNNLLTCPTHYWKDFFYCSTLYLSKGEVKGQATRIFNEAGQKL